MNKLIMLMLGLIIVISNSSLAQSAEKPVTRWLVLDPVEIQMPVMSSSKNDLKDMLSFSHLKIVDLWPAEDDQVQWDRDTYEKWQQIEAEEGQLIIKKINNSDSPQISYAAFYIHADQWLNLNLKISSEHLHHLFFDV